MPNGLDDFVEHFERRFLESQEELGMDIVGQFRVLDTPDRFVWVRRYLDPTRRVAGLKSFYTGPVWAEFGPRANELMIDHTDVHLLEPDASAPTFAPDHVPHANREAPAETRGSPVVAAIYDIPSPGRIPPDLAAAMDEALASGSVTELGRLVTSTTPNGFPALPVHENPVALWLLSADIPREAATPTKILRLEPTARSTLVGARGGT